MNSIAQVIHSLPRFRRGAVVALTALAAAVPLLMVAPAKADHADARVIISSGGFTVAYRDECGRPSKAGNWTAREYERGVKAGRCEGFDEGYRDGLRGSAFCDKPRIDFCNLSRPFKDGYFSAFACAYRDGFEKGRCERRCEDDRWRHDRHPGRGNGPWWRR